uniref:Superoxide dismutase [Cu-Zn] n=1 Tax=Mus musculus TaxID=10090 RepID=Q8C355_MOUSE|nr:unnamed protein product [Mus musculus]
MAMKAVCVLKGDGPVQGTIHFEQKARPGARGAGRGDAAHLCGSTPRPRHGLSPLSAESPWPGAGAGRREARPGAPRGLPGGRGPPRAPERLGLPGRAGLASVILLGLLLFRCPCPTGSEPRGHRLRLL